mmetsp:Transcript_5889/g.10178  ORF Transcript_5889/g.10178 Transcript_5889/m.10178 type:complete len:223 (-) Transcript_5889:671-1339(-)
MVTSRPARIMLCRPLSSRRRLTLWTILQSLCMRIARLQSPVRRMQLFGLLNWISLTRLVPNLPRRTTMTTMTTMTVSVILILVSMRSSRSKPRLLTRTWALAEPRLALIRAAMLLELVAMRASEILELMMKALMEALLAGTSPLLASLKNRKRNGSPMNSTLVIDSCSTNITAPLITSKIFKPRPTCLGHVTSVRYLTPTPNVLVSWCFVLRGVTCYRRLGI